MKTKLFLFGLLISVPQFLFAQTPQLWGSTLNGGSKGGGTIFKINGDGSGYSDQYAFQYPYSPIGDLLQAGDGMLYGLTPGGGTNSTGTLFRVNPSTNIKTELYSFSSSTGNFPNGSLIQPGNGKLYGMAGSGGANNLGGIFSYDPVSNSYNLLFSFDSLRGYNPGSTLTRNPNGKLYGLMGAGGINNEGVVFSFDTTANTYVDLFDFDGVAGIQPVGALTLATNNKMYGMTYHGGANASGNIFSFNTTNNACLSLVDMADTTGYFPYGSLIEASNQKLYGMTYDGGLNYYGVLFSYDFVNNIYTDLVDLDYSTGGYPYGSLMQATNGNLYGVTSQGGANGPGTIVSFDPSINSLNIEHNLATVEGASPQGSLIQATNGKFYGMTTSGGLNSSGVIFSFNSGIYYDLYDFPGTDGYWPQYNFILANNGKFYGMTSTGGAHNAGVIYSFDPHSGVYSRLYDFNDALGSYPYGGLTQATNGLLYGMTSAGGSYGYGVLFSYDIASNLYTDLLDFNDTNGNYPFTTSLIQLSNGKLYGTTFSGGANHYGVLFSYDPATGVYSDLHDFDNTHGRACRASLMRATDGKLYGTARGGATSNGVIFSFDISNNTYTDLYDFNGTTGNLPHSSLVQASNGKLYGTAQYGGTYDVGVLFSFNPINNNYSVLVDFDTLEGAFPYRNLVPGRNGLLYGGTGNGGIYNDGVLFSFDPINSIYTKLMDFSSSMGYTPVDVLELHPGVGIEEPTHPGFIVASPNPFSSTTMLQLSSFVQDAVVVIYDIVGKEVFRRNFSGQRMEIKRGLLQPGVYFVKVQDEERNWVEKIVVE